MHEEFPFHNFFPFVIKDADKNYDCGMVLNAYIFSSLWMNELGNRSKRMRCDYILTKAAQKHAEFLSSRTVEQEKFSMHVGRNNSYPNQRAIDEGYSLPNYYEYKANNIESCHRGSLNPEDALNHLLDSPPHYNHIAGQGWFVDHVVYGIGYSVKDWVILIAPSN